MSFGFDLDDVIARKRQWIAAQKRDGVEGVYRAQAMALPLPPSFHDALRMPRGERAVIAEIGRTSPWADTPITDLDVGATVQKMEAAGASAIAVYTDELVFGGSYTDVLAAAQVTSVPVLAKDFIIDPLQIVMARAHGASAVLLVGTLLEERELRALIRQAWDLGLGVVVEAHTALELDALTKIRFGPTETSSVRIMGVSSRDLRSSTVDTTLHERLATNIPDHCVRVAEGVFDSAEDIKRLEEMGYDAFFSDAFVRDPEGFETLLRAQCEPRD